MKAVMLSLRPQWCEKIFSGEKTIEVRKSAPKLEPPFKVYVYETKTGFIEAVRGTCPICAFSRGKVIGSFVCDRVRLCIPFGLKGHLLSQEVYREMCLTKEQLDKYGGLKTLYGWHITEPKLFDKPKELGAFRKVCLNGKCSDCIYEECKIIRPPQSWQYVEELQ